VFFFSTFKEKTAKKQMTRAMQCLGLPVTSYSQVSSAAIFWGMHIWASFILVSGPQLERFY